VKISVGSDTERALQVPHKMWQMRNSNMGLDEPHSELPSDYDVGQVFPTDQWQTVKDIA
jgi:hypothetical protein